MSTAPALPETAAVHWRPRADARRLRSRGRTWTLTTVAHTVPFIGTAAGLFALEPLSFPVGLGAARARVGDPGALRAPRRQRRAAAPARRAGRRAGGARAARRPRRPRRARAARAHRPRARARGARRLARGRGGRRARGPGGRRVFCWCVQVPEPGLPSADRIAHLLLALRADEEGFATVANLAFSGAPWRLRRRMPPRTRPALDAGVRWPACRGRRCEHRVNGPCPIRASVDRSCFPCPPHPPPAASSSCPPPPPPAPKAPSPGVRRFRLAQLRLEGRDVPRCERFTHLKRSYD